jgi:O-antigen/teichoic acid export membrane protein
VTESNIRLKYSGFVLFASRLLSVATGIAFILMVTRSVSPEEFGIWGNVLDLIGYFTLFAGVLPFWTTRFVAREYAGSAKTGLLANIFISVASASFYLALVPIILSSLQISGIYSILYVTMSIQILELHTTFAMEAILRTKQPQTIGFGLLIHEVCKVLLGFALIIQFKLGLLGALYSIILSYLILIAFYSKIISKELKENFRCNYLKEWFKGSSINVYNIIGDRIIAFSSILLFIYGGELARAYFGAAATIATIIGHSSFLAFALYPRLLSGGNIEDVSTSLKLVMMFAVPMTAGIMVLSSSYLTILEIAYAEARPALLLLAITVLCRIMSGVFSTIVKGTEKVDAKAKIAFRELVKSRLFLLFTIPYIQSIVWLPTVYFVLTAIAKTPLEASTYLALITLLQTSASLIATYIMARKSLVFRFPWKNVFKYVLASTVMAAVLLVIPHPTRLSITVAYTLLGAAMYLVILTAIDKETRSLAKSILQEAMRILKFQD